MSEQYKNRCAFFAATRELIAFGTRELIAFGISTTCTQDSRTDMSVNHNHSVELLTSIRRHVILEPLVSLLSLVVRPLPWSFRLLQASMPTLWILLRVEGRSIRVCAVHTSADTIAVDLEIVDSLHAKQL